MNKELLLLNLTILNVLNELTQTKAQQTVEYRESAARQTLDSHIPMNFKGLKCLIGSTNLEA